MATYFVDDGGDGSTGAAWATAELTIADLDTAQTFASGDIVYFGADHVQATRGSALTITGPSSGKPISFVSSTVGSGTTVSYSPSSTAQIETAGGAYNITFDGSFALYGISVKGAQNIYLSNDSNESFYVEDCTFALGANGLLGPLIVGTSFVARNITISCAADSGASTGAVVANSAAGSIEITGVTFTNGTNRTGTVFASSWAGAKLRVSGGNLATFTNATLCEVFNPASATAGWSAVFSNLITAATWAPVNSAAVIRGCCVEFYNCGPANAPTYLYVADYFGEVLSSSSIYRSDGAVVEGDATSWLITTNGNSIAAEGAPFFTPWIYGEVGSTGSKTFDVYITNDTADFTDGEVWLEVEYLGTATEAQSEIATDHRVVTTTAANQTDDTGSTWNGSGPSFTFKQKLSVTATVDEAGLYRARVACGVSGIAASRYFFVDPFVTVS